MFCDSRNIIKKAKRNGVRRYLCKKCGKWSSSKRRPTKLTSKIFKEYLYNKQTLDQLSDKYKKGIKWVKKQINNHKIKLRKRNPRKVTVVGDATFFGKRKNKNQKGVLVFRDAIEKENLIWKHIFSEKVGDYFQLKFTLENKGYTIQAMVIDGRRGVPRVFKDTPLQLCQFHQIKTVTTKLTRKPKLEEGKELREITLTLTKTTEEVFIKKLNGWHKKHKDFLEEKTLSIETGKSSYTHKRLRSAYNNLNKNLPYLFTYQKYPELNIPNTTNSLDGGVFSHLKTLLKNHRGLGMELREKLIDDYLNKKAPEK